VCVCDTETQARQIYLSRRTYRLERTNPGNLSCLQVPLTVLACAEYEVGVREQFPGGVMME